MCSRALSGYTWWNARGGAPTQDVSAVIVLLIQVGVAAGLASGRFRDSAVSWLAAFAGSVLACGVTNLIDPGLPDQHSSFPGHELLNVAFLLPLVGGGHLLGVWAGTASRRSRFGAVFAGLGICALCLLGVCGATRPTGRAERRRSWSGPLWPRGSEQAWARA